MHRLHVAQPVSAYPERVFIPYPWLLAIALGAIVLGAIVPPWAGTEIPAIVEKPLLRRQAQDEPGAKAVV